MNVVTIVLMLIGGLCFVRVYRMGFADGQKSKEGKEIDINPVIPKIKSRSERIRDKKSEDILENINNYNGSGIGQKDIK